jgi:hypothetical protein
MEDHSKKKMKDDLQKDKNGRRPQKNKMEDDLKKNNNDDLKHNLKNNLNRL